MKLVKPNWYGFDHSIVAQKFEGNPKFLNDFCVNGEYQPSAVYYCADPNRDKGHKNYMLLTKFNEQFFVRGMDQDEIDKFRYQEALHCKLCDDLIYSINRHDFRSCTCGKVSIDGGKDYTKVSFSSDSEYRMVTLDLITDTIIKKKKGKTLEQKSKKKTKRIKKEES